MRSLSLSGRSALIVLACTLGVTACRIEQGSNRVISERWVSGASWEGFSLSDVSRETTIFDWRLSDSQELERWQLKSIDPRSRPVAHGLRVVPDGPHPGLVRAVNFEAEAVDRIDIEIQGVRRGFIRLLWAGPQGTFDTERSARLEIGNNDSSIFGFELLEHPGWSGDIRRLRLIPTSLPDQTVVVVGLRGVQYQLDEGELDGMVDRPRRLELDHEVRTGVVMATGGGWRRTIDVPTGGILEFHFGLPTRPIGSRLEVVAHPDTDDEELLYSAVLDRRGVWERVIVDLGNWVGTTMAVELRLAGSKEPEGGCHELVYVAEPVVLRMAGRDEPRPNVVVILIDTLRADRLSLNGYHRPTTPHIDAWAREHAVNFTNTIAPAPWTLPSHVSLFTGSDAIVHGRNHDETVPVGVDLLAEQLQRAGYTTQAVTGGVFLHPRFGLDQGFDAFRYWPSDRPQGEEIEDGTNQAIRALNEYADRPFFLFFHTYEVHKPYHQREPFFSSYTGTTDSDLKLKVHREPSDASNGFVDRRTFRAVDGTGEHEFTNESQVHLDALYDSGVAYADQHISRFLEQLEALRSDRATLVIVTSDHGEALGERGGLASHAYLYDFNVRIPLIVSLPGAERAEREIERQVRLVDVLPTILDVAGVLPTTETDGRSLLALIADPAATFPGEAWSYAASTNQGLALRLENRLKFTFNDSIWQPVRGDEELYRLRKDPDERENLIPGDGEELAELRGAMGARLGAASAGLLVTIENRQGDPALLKLSPVAPTRVKAVSVSEAVEVEHGKGAVQLSLPAMSRVELRIESPHLDRRHEIEVLDHLGKRVCEYSVDLQTLAGESRTCVAAACCGQEMDSSWTDVVELRLLPLGEMGVGEGGASAPIDDELKQKLEALGYLQGS